MNPKIPPIPEHEQGRLQEELPTVGQTPKDYRKWVVWCVVALMIVGVIAKQAFKKDDTATVVPPPESSQKMPDYHTVNKPELLKKVVIKKEAPHENVELLKMKMVLLAQQEKMYRMRQNAPISLYKADNTGSSGVATSNTVSTASNNGVTGQLPLSDAQVKALKKAQAPMNSDESFAERSKTDTVEREEATMIPYRQDTVTQGTMIAGVLQTEINSDLPGMIKANVSQDVYGNTGDKLLIPKGSTLIGQYSSGIAMGQQRVFVMWTRLIRPDGVSMMLGSPGTDRLGTAGLGADVLQTHFWERFGGATLVSIVGGLVATAGVSEDAGYNSASDYRMMMADNFQQSANATLLSTVSRKPTIIVYQGSKINVFVNRDLSFHDVEVNHAG